MTALKSYLDEITLLATSAQENSVKYYQVALGAEEPHPLDFDNSNQISLFSFATLITLI
jgi:hypothetical protein